MWELAAGALEESVKEWRRVGRGKGRAGEMAREDTRHGRKETRDEEGRSGEREREMNGNEMEKLIKAKRRNRASTRNDF